MFSTLKDPPADPILGLAKLFGSDQSPNKVDLGIGVYKDENGHAAILQTIKEAEEDLVRNQPTKAYISSAGNSLFNDEIRKLVLGNSGRTDRARTVQTPGGTSAVRAAASLLQKLKPEGRVFIPTPTWPNHKAIFPAVGLELVTYPYYDVPSGKLTFDAMMASLEGLTAEDTLLLHGCCHNPTGADLNENQWQAVSELLEKTGATPLIDFAYQGFGKGLDEDATPLRNLVDNLPETLIASSCSKNFAVYRERVGAITIVGENSAAAEKAKGHLMPLIRSNYSMPPDHGAAVIASILSDTGKAAQWRFELEEMRVRVSSMRQKLVDYMTAAGADKFSYLKDHQGMFAMLGLTPSEVKEIREGHHVHITTSGRINVAGLTESNVKYVAEAIAAVL
ncbi:amino acid aminotransferase [Parasphingorhabdus cellanae]|uniref:Aminotransferase n=1 Tax=Parasphingorhabdus cellanae TaxID=2806553 RepID=A0ABX7T2Q0_9SPHN|nr:amino acid aminotransferase [Parasphingorhabdus cellanae]QTD55824.1 aspartate/tyrosine/aromatic aminotransferase [Parasphingorhabdus cellanae]